MDYRIEGAIAEDFMYEYQFVEYMVIHEYKNDNKLMYRNRISHLLDWAYINIAKGYSTPVSNKPKPNNILTKNDIKTFGEFYVNVLFPAHYSRNKNYLLYYGKDNAHNGFRFIDVTDVAFGANDDFNEGSKIKLDKYNL